MDSTEVQLPTARSQREPLGEAVRSAGLTDLAIVLSLGAALAPYGATLVPPTLSGSGYWNLVQDSWGLMAVSTIPVVLFGLRLRAVQTGGRSSGRPLAAIGGVWSLLCAGVCLGLFASLGVAMVFYSDCRCPLPAGTHALLTGLLAASCLFVIAAIAGFIAAGTSR